MSTNNPFGQSPFNFPRRTPGEIKKPGPLALTVIALAVIGVVLISLSGFYADLLWFRSVNFVSVWSKVLFTKAELLLFFGFVTSIFVTANVYIG